MPAWKFESYWPLTLNNEPLKLFVCGHSLDLTKGPVRLNLDGG